MSDNEARDSVDASQEEIDRLEAELATLQDDRAGLVAKIEALDKSIADVSAQLAAAKERAAVALSQCVCQSCGAMLAPTDRFCGVCGAKTDGEKSLSATSPLLCSACGGPLRRSDKFCMSCGAKVVSGDASGKGDGGSGLTSACPYDVACPPYDQAGDISDDSLRAEVMHRHDGRGHVVVTCPSCGAVATDDLEFCIECGAKM